MNSNSAFSKLAELGRKLEALEHAQAMLGVDEAVMMPNGGGEKRAESMAMLAGMYHELATAPEIDDWLTATESEPLDEMQRAAIREQRRVYTNMTCLSSDFVRRQVTARVRSEQLWRELRAKDDWTGFLPAFEGVVALAREEAELRAKALNLAPYDAMMEQYDPGNRAADIARPRPSKAGQPTPMEVLDTPFRGGDLRHGYQAVADNLPNDPRIHEQKGTKKIFFKNYMDARVNDVILPLAKGIMDPQQAAQASAEGYMASTVMHEICHGLGPAYSRTSAGRKDIREALADVFPGLEEAKADIVGMYSLKFLMDKGVLPKEREQEYYASYVAGIFRTVRFGVGEAHGRAEMMEFNYLSEQKAISRDASGRYHIDYAKMPDSIGLLAKELLEQEATGDRNRASAWFQKYDVMPSELRSSFAQLRSVPVDLDPVQPFPEKVQ